MRTVALVGMNGSIDWYCYPHFDSPSVFGAILDDKKGGRFQLRPKTEQFKCKQLYWPNTNVLVTRFLLVDGVIEIEDFMPVGLSSDSPWYHQLFRRVRCVRGPVKMTLECRPAFDYGRKSHKAEIEKGGMIFETPELKMGLSTDIPLERDDAGGAISEFVLESHECKVLIFKKIECHGPCELPPSLEEAEELFQSTVKFWRRWLSSCTYRGRWREQVYRSALVLKLLTFEPTGAIIAAPTMSLPEVIGGSRNWDYRFSWVRDSAFTVYALLRIGLKEEAAQFRSWIQNFLTKEIKEDKPFPVLFTIHGEISVPELVLSHWEGYRQSSPVRMGNGAAFQFQNDIYGEFLDTVYLINKYVMPISYDNWTRLRLRLNWICENWTLPDDGIWEVRNQREHFVYSKVMCWVALDRGIRLADKRSLPSDRDLWSRNRDLIYEEVMTRGWNNDVQAFTQVYGKQDLDASLLIMPMVFFISPSDPKMLHTIDAILRTPDLGGLVSDGLVYRYPPGSRIDGLPGEEGTFNMCSFWLVEALTRAGISDYRRLDLARLLFERMMGYANHLGLFSEQTGPQGEALGNFPQAFTHLALISAAFNLDRTLGSRP